MFWIILPLFSVVINASKFDNTYLSPPNGKDAGGHRDDLQLPLQPQYIDPYSYRDDRYSARKQHKTSYNSGSSRSPSIYQPFRSRDTFDYVHESSFGDMKGRIMCNSYTYPGPDNILVTITYAPHKKLTQATRFSNEGDYDNKNRQTGGHSYNDDFRKGSERNFDYSEAAGYQRKTKEQSSVNTQKPIIHQGYSHPGISVNQG